MIGKRYSKRPSEILPKSFFQKRGGVLSEISFDYNVALKSSLMEAKVYEDRKVDFENKQTKGKTTSPNQAESLLAKARREEW